VTSNPRNGNPALLEKRDDTLRRMILGTLLVLGLIVAIGSVVALA
jgi:hypothetical protein